MTMTELEINAVKKAVHIYPIEDINQELARTMWNINDLMNLFEGELLKEDVTDYSEELREISDNLSEAFTLVSKAQAIIEEDTWGPIIKNIETGGE